jgi:hypothetical protein
MSQTRRLAAILAADVAGYSRLIRADEVGTLRRCTWQCDFSGTTLNHEWLIWVGLSRSAEVGEPSRTCGFRPFRPNGQW